MAVTAQQAQKAEFTDTSYNAVRHAAGVTLACMATTRMTAFVHGRVQGVGFRWWVRSRALELGLAGHATNLRDGRVQVVAEGGRQDVATLLGLLREQPSSADRPGSVELVVEQYAEPRGESGFEER